MADIEGEFKSVALLESDPVLLVLLSAVNSLERQVDSAVGQIFGLEDNVWAVLESDSGPEDYLGL